MVKLSMDNQVLVKSALKVTRVLSEYIYRVHIKECNQKSACNSISKTFWYSRAAVTW